MAKLVVFTRSGEPISDFDVVRKVDEFLSSKRKFWRVGNQLTIDWFRVRVKQNVVNSNDIAFLVEELDGTLIWFNVDKQGRSNNWTESQEVQSNVYTEILT